MQRPNTPPILSIRSLFAKLPIMWVRKSMARKERTATKTMLVFTLAKLKEGDRRIRSDVWISPILT